MQRSRNSFTKHPWKHDVDLKKTKSRQLKQRSAFISRFYKVIRSPSKKINYSNFPVRTAPPSFVTLDRWESRNPQKQETGGVAVHSKRSFHYCHPCSANNAKILSGTTPNYSQPISQHVLGSRCDFGKVDVTCLRRSKFLKNYELKLLLDSLFKSYAIVHTWLRLE